MSASKPAKTAGMKNPGPLTFTAKLQRSERSGAACFVDFPWDLHETFGKGNLVPVTVTWDGRVPYRGSLARMQKALPLIQEKRRLKG